jgi:hypothetical protein
MIGAAGADRKREGLREIRSAGGEFGLIRGSCAHGGSMRSISFSALARTLAAALLVAAFAVGAHARPDGDRHVAHAPHGHGGGGPVFGANQGGCGGGLELAPPFPFAGVGESVEAFSLETQDYIRACQCVTRECVADALDRYAEALAAVAPRLPPQLQDMPNVVARAARQVRAARTKGEAVKALRAAIAVIHKDISLVRAEDPATQQSATRSGGFVAETLAVASLSLQQAGGL